MGATRQRDRVIRLAKTNVAAALKSAREIPDAWFRSQALAAVARWIDDKRAAAVAAESLASAELCDDDYKRATVAAWPIRALTERGLEKQAKEALGKARRRALIAEPDGSRAEALLSLLQGGWGLGKTVRRQLVEDLASLEQRSNHWRVQRAVVNALGMLGGVDEETAREFAGIIGDDKCRRKALKAIEARGTHAPREYF